MSFSVILGGFETRQKHFFAFFGEKSVFIRKIGDFSPIFFFLIFSSQYLFQHHRNPIFLRKIGRNRRFFCPWEKPWQEWVKLNVDAAIFNDSSSVNSSSEFIAAKAMQIYQKLGPKEAETMGVREALSWIKQMVLTKVLVVEMDSQVVFIIALKITSPSSFTFYFVD